MDPERKKITLTCQHCGADFEIYDDQILQENDWTEAFDDIYEVSMFLGYDCKEQCGCADFYTVPDGDNCIISLTSEDREPYKAREVQIDK